MISLLCRLIYIINAKGAIKWWIEWKIKGMTWFWSLRWVTCSGIVHLCLNPCHLLEILALEWQCLCWIIAPREAEIAYGKHSSPEAVKTFIIITNLQAPTEPGGCRSCQAGSPLPQPPHFTTVHIEGWKDLSCRTHKKLFIGLYIATVPSLKTEGWEESVCVYVCFSLWEHAYPKENILCVCLLVHCVFLCACVLSANRMRLTFMFLFIQNAYMYTYDCVSVSVCDWKESL